MVPDGWTDGRNGRTDGRTHGRRQNYIPPTSSGDNKVIKTMSSLHQQGNVSMQLNSKLSTVGLDCMIPDVCLFSYCYKWTLRSY